MVRQATLYLTGGDLRAGVALYRPLPMLAIGVLALNDHVLKGAGLLPGWLTGKLSDVAGLFFFPVFLVALARQRIRRTMAAAAAVVLTGIAFAAVKTSSVANTWVSGNWGTVRLDPTDLLALPALAASFCWMIRSTPPNQSRGSRVGQSFGIFLAAAATIATSPWAPSMLPQHPLGESAAAVIPMSCAIVGDYEARIIVEFWNDSPDAVTAELTAIEETITTSRIESSMSVRPATPIALGPGGKALISVDYERIYPFDKEGQQLTLLFVSRQSVGGIAKESMMGHLVTCSPPGREHK